MRIFIAGATGVVGRRLVPLLVERGHEVVGLTRFADKQDVLARLGARPVIADALDEAAVRSAVALAEPDAVVHQLTDLSRFASVRRFERAFARTNRLRTEGTDHLLAAARAAGARRFVAQSFGGWTYARTGGPVKTEDDPLDPSPFPAQASTLGAIRHLERAVTGAEDLRGVALRYGAFYGPGTSLGPGGEHLEAVRRRRFPIVGSGAGVWSFAHADDVAAATVAAIEGDVTGVFNVVDDEPAPVREWLPALADMLGAGPPPRLPAWIARLAIGAHGVAMMTEVRGASNAKARRELGWTPRYPSWREGFRPSRPPSRLR
jgi:nucleoside-diphosphate-sugar epimerase